MKSLGKRDTGKILPKNRSQLKLSLKVCGKSKLHNKNNIKRCLNKAKKESKQNILLFKDRNNYNKSSLSNSCIRVLLLRNNKN